MTEIQLFAYVVLPIGIAVCSWIVALAINPPRWLRHTPPSHHTTATSGSIQN
jgi:hypothetical protein